jgi:hypothetical protein
MAHQIYIWHSFSNQFETCNEKEGKGKPGERVQVDQYI